MADKQSIIQFCPKGADYAAKLTAYNRAKESREKNLVERVFKIFGAEKSGKITRDQIIAVDKKDGCWVERGLEMNRETLSRLDIQIALKSKYIDKKEAAKNPISQNEFAKLLGGCYSQEGAGTSLIITRDQAMRHLKSNEADLKKLEVFMALM